MRWELDDLVAMSDIAELYGVGRPAVSNWRVRYPDFPQPLTAVAGGETLLFSRTAVVDWYNRRPWRHEGPGSEAKYR